MLPGLDVQRGLAAMRGNAEKYLRLLRQFGAGHADDMARVTKCLEAGDVAGACLVAHGLKGVTGTLGLVRLAGQAAQLDASLRATGHAEPALIDALAGELLALRTALDALPAPIRK
jgi:HPt (histidine-containing phosphotransfer) domain-containing protein